MKPQNEDCYLSEISKKTIVGAMIVKEMIVGAMIVGAMTVGAMIVGARRLSQKMQGRLLNLFTRTHILVMNSNLSILTYAYFSSNFVLSF